MPKKAKTPDELANLAANADRNGKFEDAMHHYRQYMDSDLRMDAILGYGFSAVKAKRFEDAVAVLAPASAEGRFQFRKIASLLAGYCFTALQMQPEADKYFDSYTTEIVRGADKVNPQDIDFSYRDLDDDDAMEIDPDEEDDEYYSDDNDGYDDDDLPEPIKYSSYMRHYALATVVVPGIVESWADYLEENQEKWLLTDQPDSWRIGNALHNIAGDITRRILKKAGKKETAANDKIAARFNDLAAVFRPDFAANAMYAKATALRRKDAVAGIRMLREMIQAFPEHTRALQDLSVAALEENDVDLAVTLMERAAAVYEKYGWVKGTAGDKEKNLYLSAGIQYAKTGNYTKGASVMGKYLALTQPKVLKAINWPDCDPEDIWIVMCNDYQPRYHPYIVPPFIAEQALLFADTAVAVNNSVKSHMARANTLLNNGRYEEAMENIRAGYAIDPGDAIVPFYHVCALALTDAPVDKALDVMKQALEIDPAIMAKFKSDFKLFKFRATPAFKEIYG